MSTRIPLYGLLLLMLFGFGCSEHRPAGPPDAADQSPAAEPDPADVPDEPGVGA